MWKCDIGMEWTKEEMLELLDAAKKDVDNGVMTRISLELDNGFSMMLEKNDD